MMAGTAWRWMSGAEQSTRMDDKSRWAKGLNRRDALGRETERETLGGGGGAAALSFRAF